MLFACPKWAAQNCSIHPCTHIATIPRRCPSSSSLTTSSSTAHTLSDRHTWSWAPVLVLPTLLTRSLWTLQSGVVAHELPIGSSSNDFRCVHAEVSCWKQTQGLQMENECHFSLLIELSARASDLQTELWNQASNYAMNLTYCTSRATVPYICRYQQGTVS